MAGGEPRALPGFGVAVSFLGQNVVLAVEGELDPRKVHKLGAVLDAMLDRGHQEVALDLAEAEFLDATALGTVLGALAHPGPSDRGFKLRSPSAMVGGSIHQATERELPMSADGGSFARFGMAVRFSSEQVRLAIWGEIDLLTAPEMGSVLDAVIDRGRTGVVLDLAECRFMDASGLGVIASAANRLGRADGVLAIASPSPMVTRLLNITGLNTFVQVELSAEVGDRLGPEQSASSADTPPGTPGKYLRTVTAIPADDDVVDGALRLVVALAKATVRGADGVSVSLRRHGRLATVVASNQTISDMDADQYATGEGPCVDASVKGRWFHVESVDTETRWPAFTPRAQALGINSILSSPLLAEDRPVGALNIYSRTTGAFAAKEQELAAIFATEASVILRDAGLGISDEKLTERRATSLRTRQTIALATGILMERESISEEDAFNLLRNFSRSSNQPLADRAAEIVESARRPPPPLQQEHGGSGG